MSISNEIRQLIKNKMVIRHRTINEQPGKSNLCLICSREINASPATLCLALGDEGLVCSVCGNRYAPEMMAALGEQQPKARERNPAPQPTTSLSTAELIAIAREIDSLAEISADLAKGIARGIVEAPAGHIGLMHYAKDIKKPARKESESDKDYELRIRTYRMTRLYEKIHADTVGRIQKLKQHLQKIGLPSITD